MERTGGWLIDMKSERFDPRGERGFAQGAHPHEDGHLEAAVHRGGVGGEGPPGPADIARGGHEGGSPLWSERANALQNLKRGTMKEDAAVDIVGGPGRPRLWRLEVVR